MGLKMTISRGGRVFLWMTDIRSGLYEKPIFNAQSCTFLCQSQFFSDKVRQSTWEKTWYSQNLEKVVGGFHQPLG